MLKQLFETDRYDYATMVIRVALWAVIFAHGAQKMLWWWWGSWYTATIEAFTQNLGLPWIIAFLVIIIEFFWWIGLMVWWKTRPSAFWILVVLIWAVVVWWHLEAWFFIDWFGRWTGNGIEFHILAMAMAIHLIIKWWWAFSFDSIVAKYFK